MIQPNEVAIILINFRNAKNTIDCLNTIHKLSSKPLAVIVVDNRSFDNSLSEIFAAWRQWEEVVFIRASTSGCCALPDIGTKEHAFLISLQENGGYAKANNAGIRFAQQLPSCKAYWILNNDTLLDSYALQSLCEKYNTNKENSLVGSTLIFTKDMETLQCTAGHTFFPFFGFDKALNQGIKLNELNNVCQNNVNKKLNLIVGASIFIPKKIINTIGLLKEEYFLYFEETEFCSRAKKNNISLIWAKESLVFHKEGSTTQTSSYDKALYPLWVDYLMIRNRAHLVRTHYPYAIPALCISFIGIIVKRILRKQIGRIPMLYKALTHGLCGKLGKPDLFMQK